ncbi:MAG: extracellular solute-binding protein [Bacteroidetes bacterium]|nr:extracellular solute-binding protein [Bacteroidota bacterium]
MTLLYPLLLMLLMNGFPEWNARSLADRQKIVVSGWATSEEEQKELQARISQFNASQDQILATYEPIPLTDYYNESIISGFRSGLSADIFYVRDADLPLFISHGGVLNLNRFLERGTPGKSDFHQPALDAFRLPGNQYFAIPKDFNYIGLVVNETWREACGLSAGGPATLDDLAIWFEKMSSSGFKQNTHVGALVFRGHDFEVFPLVVSLYGNRPLQPFEPSEVIGPSLTYFSWWAVNKWMLPEYNVRESTNYFARQQAGSVIEGIWFFPYLTQNFPDLRFRIYPFPAAEAGQPPVLILTTVGWGIWSGTKHPEAAWKVLTFLVSDFSYDRWLKESVAYPPMTSQINQIIRGKESRSGARELLTVPARRVPLSTWSSADINVLSKEVRTMLLFRKYPGDSRETVEHLLNRGAR